MVIGAVGTVLAAGYLLWMFQRVAMGEPKGEFADLHVHDVHGPEWIAWSPLLLLIVVLGFYPNFLFSTFDPAVTHLVHGMSRAL
jgi:NADH-quinone oxidoreductase subunit M